MAEYALPLTVLFFLSAVTSFFATRIVKAVAERVGAIDVPDDRKLHVSATPRLGGLAIIFGFGFPLMLLAGVPRAAELVSKNLTYLFAVLASGSLVVGLGVYDDLLGSDATKKFLVQGSAAVILVAFGFHFSFISLNGKVFQLGIFGLLMSIVWIVGVMNAVNFIDGMDSLATIVAITIAIAYGVIGILRYDIFTLVIMTALAGSLIGFYPWNKPPAKIFMGDTGSLFIGLLLAACSIAKPSKSPTALLVGGPILALALPVIDTLIVMKQRFAGRAIPTSIGERVSRMFNADRRHIHHILTAKYGSAWRAILSIWVVTVLFAAAAVLTVVDELKVYGYAAGLAALLSLLLLRYFRPVAS